MQEGSGSLHTDTRDLGVSGSWLPRRPSLVLGSHGGKKKGSPLQHSTDIQDQPLLSKVPSLWEIWGWGMNFPDELIVKMKKKSKVAQEAEKGNKEKLVFCVYEKST